jgi:predicted DNA-binding transcriptional regulator AlpA
MISITELLERIPISRTTLDKMVKEGTFPRPYPIRPTKFGFFLDDVVNWQKQLVRATKAVGRDESSPKGG